jgi:hypothetical protein
MRKTPRVQQESARVWNRARAQPIHVAYSNGADHDRMDIRIGCGDFCAQ